MAKEVNKRINIWLNQRGIEDNLKSVRAAISKTTNELAKLPAFSEEWYRKSRELNQLKKIYADMQKEIKATGSELSKANEITDNTIFKVGALGAAYTAASSALSRFVSATQEYVDAYATLDDAMSAVQKTTGMTREEVELLHESLKSIDTRTSTEELLKIAEIGGRMGLAKEQIRDFTEAVNKANVALGDSFQGGAEEISSVLGKIALAYKETRDQNIGEALTQIGSALNEVGASANATESNIASFVQRVGSMPEAFRPTVQQAVALGAAFEESSIEAEVASRAFGIVMTKAASNVEKFASVMQRPAEEIRELINTNPAQFFVEFAESLQGLEATDVASILKDLKLNADGVNKIIGAMSTNTERFAEILTTSNTAFEEAISLDKEYATVNENSAAQLEKAKKAVQDAKAALGEELLPVIVQLTQSSAGALRVATTVAKFWAQHRALLISLAAAYGAVKVAQKAVILAQEQSLALTLKNTAAGNAYRTVVFLLATAKAKLAGSTAAAAVAQKSLSAAFAATPWGAIITAVAAIATGLGILISKHNEAQKSSERFNVECAKEQAEAERLFSKLKKAEKGTEEYKDALDKLKEKYPEIIKKHLDEEGALRDVEQAYKDVITQIQAKVAAQIKEDELTKATEEGIKDQVKALRGFNESQKAIIRQMAEQGKTVEQIGSKLGISYYFKDFQGNLVKDDRFQALKDYVSAYQKMKQDIVAIDKKYDPYLQQAPTSNTAGTNGNSNTNGNENGPGSGGPSSSNADEKLQTKISNFEKKLQEFRTRQQRETLDGWEKTKQTVIDNYQSMIDEAAELNLTATVRRLEEERVQAVIDAGQKYIAEKTKTLETFSQKFQQWAKESMPDSGNEMLDAVLGTHEKWKERMNEAVTQLNELLELRDSMLEEGTDTTSLDALINKVELSLDDINGMQAQDLQKVLQKYQQQTDNFIKEEQRSLTDATLTEKERQKAAIEEKYRLEIEYIEKTIAARIAAYGEDDPEVKQLREKITLLQQLKGQQIANIGKTSGNRNIWQQLVEFDWSQMNTNWQSAIALMGQGLNDFANTAFSVYNSILDIQNQTTETGLQKAQEAYDAKSAALKRQLNDGVISQKRYDAQMEKLQAEKDAKEKKLKHDQFAREKTANIIQAVIAGALSASQTLAQWGVPWGLIPMALALAVTAAQTAVIASQPNPYAKGGYIRGKQYAVMGEAGDEWVASNKLLRDRQAADIISALDDYQRGNRNALAGISFAAPDPKIMSQAVSGNGRTFATSNQTTNNYYQNDSNNEVLKELQKLNEYMRDPNNRRAYISREIQLEFDRQEKEVREIARL